jgi:hypothetical protein
MGELFPYLLSAVTIVAMWLAGSNWRHTWLLSTGNQFLWLAWILSTRTWGFLPMNIAMFVVSIRNHLRWKARSKGA